MKKITEIQSAGALHSDSNERGNGFCPKAGKQLGRFLFMACMAGTGILFTGCAAGYVATEPVYVEYQRPAPPSAMHIWIDREWGWNSMSHSYVQRTGYWEKPRQNSVFVSGDWRSTPKGKKWQKGHWQNTNQGKHKGYKR